MLQVTYLHKQYFLLRQGSFGDTENKLLQYLFAHPSYKPQLWTPNQFDRIWNAIKNFDASHASSGSVPVYVNYSAAHVTKKHPLTSNALDVLANVADFMASDAVVKKSLSADEFKASLSFRQLESRSRTWLSLATSQHESRLITRTTVSSPL